ncbi:MAG: ABC transporter substrate-binding protein, partial [Oceanisphaera sp.]|nr:ABC transporter substrate-binding protein [Oceanisphaera sp.]
MKTILKTSSLLALALSTTPVLATELNELESKARAEGKLYSVGMPDSWANWKDTWRDLGDHYGIQHQDTDMSSAQEIAKFAAEKDHATADIGDVGAA